MRRRRPTCALLVGLALLGASTPSRSAGDDLRAEARKTFQDARFGLFVPWGVYSLLGKGPWVMEGDRLPVSEYEKLPPRFNPAEFDAEAWVKTARSAGARYLVITAKHHDGFCMFDSRLTRYDVIDASPFARDPLGSLIDACRKHGLSPVVYYSLLDWHHPDYAPRGRTGKSAGRDDKGDWSKYVAYAQGQIRELCTNYGPIGGVWLDGVWDKPGASWDLETTYALIHDLQPGALVANTQPSTPGPGQDVQTFEQELGGHEPGAPAPDPALAWEVRHGRNASWDDRDFGSTEDVIRRLVRLAARGSNLLLGVGAMPDGTIPVWAAGRLAGVGRWLEEHGDSVYGTRPGPVAAQGWGVSTRDGGRGRPSAIYLHVFQPSYAIRLPGAALSFDARPMGTTRLLTQQQDGKNVVVRLPDPDPAAADAVIVLTPRLLGR